MHKYQDLIEIFDDTFYGSFNTRLIKGGDEPIYLPANDQCSYHQIVFAHGFYASALHEISHWCIAGSKRRELIDFGYWYEPDGRTAEQQEKFELVELKPQAIEWAFCVASNKKFTVSVDNLNGDSEPDITAFKKRVFSQVEDYLTNGFPQRAQDFIDALARFYDVSLPLSLEQFLTPFEQDKLFYHQHVENLEVSHAII
ncbi:elongation factor P hydroxylase [Thalassotalea eurytherma]|uniref:Elongation factor P hydroxylase n=1 Tax=Thalassotalea eurytherma TaxID=1144278 RepID=A0ABQ6H751_9GAMM|nr:elongation factor P hydroxylase [Thalassotalea eurytherma]